MPLGVLGGFEACQAGPAGPELHGQEATEVGVSAGDEHQLGRLIPWGARVRRFPRTSLALRPGARRWREQAELDEVLGGPDDDPGTVVGMPDDQVCGRPIGLVVGGEVRHGRKPRGTGLPATWRGGPGSRTTADRQRRGATSAGPSRAADGLRGHPSEGVRRPTGSAGR